MTEDGQLEGIDFPIKDEETNDIKVVLTQVENIMIFNYIGPDGLCHFEFPLTAGEATDMAGAIFIAFGITEPHLLSEVLKKEIERNGGSNAKN